MKKTAIVTAALLMASAASFVPAQTNPVHAAFSVAYDYNSALYKIYSDYKGENAEVELNEGENGSFTASWENTDECKFRVSKLYYNHLYTKGDSIIVDYDAEIEADGNTVVEINAVTDVGAEEIKIIEAYGDYTLPENRLYETEVELNGKVYDFFISNNSAVIYDEDIIAEKSFVTFYFVLRNSIIEPGQKNTVTNSVNISELFKAVEESCEGVRDYKLCPQYISNIYFSIENTGSNGSVELKSIDMRTEAAKEDQPSAADDKNTVPGEDVSDHLTGDINFDGSVSAVDLAVFTGYMLGSSEITEEAQKAMDIDKDGRVSIADLVRLKNILVGYEVPDKDTEDKKVLDSNIKLTDGVVTKDWSEINGWNYLNIYNESESEVTMNSGSAGGGFSGSWEDKEECLLSSYKIFDTAKSFENYEKLSPEYECDLEIDGNGYFGLYGMMSETKTEFYVIEGRGELLPVSGAEPAGTVTSDEKEYDVYHILTEDGKDQYWSVLKTSNLNPGTKSHHEGSVTLTEHAKAWIEAGMNSEEKIFSSGFLVKGIDSSGSVEVKNFSVM